MNDQAKAIIAHLTLIGWLISLVLHLTGTREPLTRFYLRQYLGLMLCGLVLSVLSRLLPFLAILSLVLLVAWGYSLIGAIRKERWGLPWVGETFQNAFRGI